MLLIQIVGLILPYYYGNAFFVEKEKVFSEIEEDINVVLLQLIVILSFKSYLLLLLLKNEF